MTARTRNRQDTLLVVCRANLIRSPLAAGVILKQLEQVGRSDLGVRSAGLQAEPAAEPLEETVRVAQERGVDLTGHRPRRVTPTLVTRAALVLTMTEAQRSAITRLSPGATPRTFTLPELARLVTAREVPPAQDWAELARSAHVGRPLVAPARRPEDVPDPVGRPVQFLQVVADDLVRWCLEVMARVAPSDTP